MIRPKSPWAPLLIFSLMLSIGAGLKAGDLVGIDQFQGLVQDTRAIAVGDSLTVLILENSQAQSNSGTDLDKDFSLGASLGKTGRTEIANINTDLGHAGNGKTARGNKVRAQVTVSIQSIDSQGRFFVAGQQSISVNGEEQLIDVSGWIRPTDVQANNTVISSRLANAKISFTGEGVLDQSQKPGFFYRFFTWFDFF